MRYNHLASRIERLFTAEHAENAENKKKKIYH
jgi:hypothetical protein